MHKDAASSGAVGRRSQGWRDTHSLRWRVGHEGGASRLSRVQMARVEATGMSGTGHGASADAEQGVDQIMQRGPVTRTC